MVRYKEQLKVLIVDDELEYREVIQMIIEDSGFITETAENAEHALLKLKESTYHIMLTDMKMGQLNGMELLKITKNKYPDMEVMLITGHGTIENAVEAMKIGAHNYIVKTQPSEKLLEEMDKVSQVIYARMNSKAKGDEPFSYLTKSQNNKFMKVLQTVEKAAKSDANILILGESGVGKEMIAHYVHRCSKRKENAFVPVHCSAISDTLLESELFGHEKGAFTGATESRQGLFKAADSGTLFLDEIGDVSLSTQVKLLRTLETRKVQSIGSQTLEPVDFRLVCATNRDLIDAIEKNEFREDFYFRINTIVVEVPALRNRPEDIPMFIDYFVQRFSSNLGKSIKDIDDEVMAYLLNHPYYGNIREMKNMIERLVVLAEDGVIDKPLMSELEAMNLQHAKGIVKEALDSRDVSLTSSEELRIDTIKPLKEVRQETEAVYIEQALKACKYNVSEAARKLGLSRRQLYNKMEQYDL